MVPEKLGFFTQPERLLTSNTNPDEEITENKESMKIEISECLENALDSLQSIWEEIGICQENRGERQSVVLLHIRNLLEEMVSEENELRKRLLASVETSGEEIYKLSLELAVQPYEAEEGLTILLLEKTLRQKVETLTKEKDVRMAELKNLKDVEQHLCDMLCTTPYYIPTGTIPTKEQLETLQEHIHTLTAEKESRQSIFTSTKKDILTLLNDLEQGPNTSFEREIVCEEEDSFLLSKENMDALRVLQTELESKLKANQKTAEHLRDRINSLWNRLMLPADERQDFSEKTIGYSPTVLKMLEEEATRLDILKKENLEKVILGSREELESWWDKCYYSRAQKTSFDGFYEDNYTEELLEQHDQQLTLVKAHYEENKEIIDLVMKREEMWKKMIEFEKRANDPNRFFSNRGGKLLQEEKERKKINRDLPKLEQSLSNRILEFEESKGRPFLVDGVRFVDYVAAQWVAHESGKKMQTSKRLEAKKKETQKEMLLGSKPSTPVKRPRLPPNSSTHTTPKSCKRRKGPNGSVAPSPRWCSSTVSMSPAAMLPPRGAHINSSRTPCASASIQSKSLIAHHIPFPSPASARPPRKGYTPKSPTPRKLRNTPTRSYRRALADKNSSRQHDNMFSMSTISGNTGPSMSQSIASNCTTYSDFAKELGSASRENGRSSTLPSPKGPRSFSRIGL